MKTSFFPFSLPPLRVFLAGVLLMLIGPRAHAEPTTEQVFELRPGWNAVFLELVPEVADSEAAFAGMPIESVWAYNPSLSTIDFVQDPVDLVLDLPGWLHYVPPPRPESLLNNLFRLQANKAYLIRLHGTAPYTWRVRGRPTLQPATWQTDAFTLTGFRVDPAAPPTLGAYLGPSAAHTGQPIYQLGAGGVWQRVVDPALTTIRSGEAYWVYTEGASTYQGPLEVITPSLGGIDFGGSLDQEKLILRNHSGFSASLEVRRLDAVQAVPVYHRVVISGVSSWQPLSATPIVLDSEAGEEHLVQLGVRRSELPLARTKSILEVKNGLGARVLVPVAAATVRLATPLAAPLGSPLGATGEAGDRPEAGLALSSTPDLSGLWVGDVAVGLVSEAQRGGTVPGKTGAAFKFRLLLHVDGSGQVRLLKEVIQMWQNGTRVPSPTDPGFTVVGERGRYVLITDETRIPDFEGASLRDGVPVGIRLSTAAYDFPGDSFAVTGSFAPGGSLTFTLSLEPDTPTNPFRHKYHPDHDNLDENFIVFREEAYAIDREMRLDFAAAPPAGAPLGWGTSEISGVFREKISGLHRHPIFVQGTFELKRVVLTPVLNQ